MRRYSRSTAARDIMIDQFGELRRAGNSLGTAKKKRKKATVKPTVSTSTPAIKDIGTITDIEQFVSLPDNLSYWKELQRTMTLIVRDVDTDLRKRIRKWAKETMAEMKAVTPVDTANLRDSISILGYNSRSAINATLDVVDSKGPIQARVGIDEAKLLPPPEYKYSLHHKVKGHFRSPKTGRFVKNRGYRVRIPNYNYAPFADGLIKVYHSEGYPGYDFLNKWDEIALNNMMRIF